MRRLIALAVAGVVLLALIVAQLVLSGVAEQELRDQLSQSGTVLQVEVSAFPAIKLLWHHADSVVVRMGAQAGKFVVAPNVPFGGLATIILFSDPHVQVQSVSAVAVPGGFRVSAHGTVT